MYVCMYVCMHVCVFRAQEYRQRIARAPGVDPLGLRRHQEPTEKSGLAPEASTEAFYYTPSDQEWDLCFQTAALKARETSRDLPLPVSVSPSDGRQEEQLETAARMGGPNLSSATRQLVGLARCTAFIAATWAGVGATQDSGSAISCLRYQLEGFSWYGCGANQEDLGPELCGANLDSGGPIGSQQCQEDGQQVGCPSGRNCGKARQVPCLQGGYATGIPERKDSIHKRCAEARTRDRGYPCPAASCLPGDQAGGLYWCTGDARCQPSGSTGVGEYVRAAHSARKLPHARPRSTGGSFGCIRTGTCETATSAYDTASQTDWDPSHDATSSWQCGESVRRCAHDGPLHAGREWRAPHLRGAATRIGIRITAGHATAAESCGPEEETDQASRATAGQASCYQFPLLGRQVGQQEGFIDCRKDGYEALRHRTSCRACRAPTRLCLGYAHRGRTPRSRPGKQGHTGALRGRALRHRVTADMRRAVEETSLCLACPLVSQSTSVQLGNAGHCAQLRVGEDGFGAERFSLNARSHVNSSVCTGLRGCSSLIFHNIVSACCDFHNPQRSRPFGHWGRAVYKLVHDYARQHVLHIPFAWSTCGLHAARDWSFSWVAPLWIARGCFRPLAPSLEAATPRFEGTQSCAGYKGCSCFVQAIAVPLVSSVCNASCPMSVQAMCAPLPWNFLDFFIVNWISLGVTFLGAMLFSLCSLVLGLLHGQRVGRAAPTVSRSYPPLCLIKALGSAGSFNNPPLIWSPAVCRRPKGSWQVVRPHMWQRWAIGVLVFLNIPSRVWAIPGGTEASGALTTLAEAFLPFADLPNPSVAIAADVDLEEVEGTPSPVQTVGFSVFAPHYQTVFSQTSVLPGEGTSSVIRKVWDLPVDLPFAYLDCAEPTVPLIDEHSISVVVFPHILDDTGHAAVIIDLSAVGGNVFAAVLPASLTAREWGPFVGALVDPRIEELDTFAGTSTEPYQWNEPLQLVHGVVLFVRGTHYTQRSGTSLDALLADSSQWRPFCNVPRPSRSPGFCLMMDSDRWFLHKSDFPRRSLLQAAASCVGMSEDTTTFGVASVPPVSNLCMHGELCSALSLIVAEPPPLPVPPARTPRQDYFVFLDLRPLGLRPQGIFQHDNRVHVPSLIRLFAPLLPSGYEIEVQGGRRDRQFIEVVSGTTLLFHASRPSSEENEVPSPPDMPSTHEGSESGSSDTPSHDAGPDTGGAANDGETRRTIRSRSPRRFGYAGCSANTTTAWAGGPIESLLQAEVTFQGDDAQDVDDDDAALHGFCLRSPCTPSPPCASATLGLEEPAHKSHTLDPASRCDLCLPQAGCCGAGGTKAFAVLAALFKPRIVWIELLRGHTTHAMSLRSSSNVTLEL